MVDPQAGLQNWFRAVRAGGYLVVTVPDEDLYEQGTFPSTFNRDHKWTFSILKVRSWSTRSLNVVDLVIELGASAELVRLEQLLLRCLEIEVRLGLGLEAVEVPLGRPRGFTLAARLIA